MDDYMRAFDIETGRAVEIQPRWRAGDPDDLAPDDQRQYW
jgi:hypothetical protein